MPQGTDDQVTVNVYGGDDGSVSPVARRDLLVRTIYPDGDDAADNVSLTYYADGAARTRTDQRGVELSFDYDDEGRPAEQKVTDAPTGLEGDRLIAYDHDEMGRMQRITTFADAAGTTATSEVERARNGLGQIASEHQAHGGAVGGQTPAVQYAYDATTDGNRFTKGHRPASMTYPDGRVLHATYGGANDDISRPDGLGNEEGMWAMTRKVLSHIILLFGILIALLGACSREGKDDDVVWALERLMAMDDSTSDPELKARITEAMELLKTDGHAAVPYVVGAGVVGSAEEGALAIRYVSATYVGGVLEVHADNKSVSVPLGQPRLRGEGEPILVGLVFSAAEWAEATGLRIEDAVGCIIKVKVGESESNGVRVISLDQ